MCVFMRRLCFVDWKEDGIESVHFETLNDTKVVFSRFFAFFLYVTLYERTCNEYQFSRLIA